MDPKTHSKVRLCGALTTDLIWFAFIIAISYHTYWNAFFFPAVIVAPHGTDDEISKNQLPHPVCSCC